MVVAPNDLITVVDGRVFVVRMTIGLTMVVAGSVFAVTVTIGLTTVVAGSVFAVAVTIGLTTVVAGSVFAVLVTIGLIVIVDFVTESTVIEYWASNKYRHLVRMMKMRYFGVQWLESYFLEAEEVIELMDFVLMM